jgi:hypothetical protein
VTAPPIPIFGVGDGLHVAGGAESGTPALLCFGVRFGATSWRLPSWLKTTTSAEVGQSGRNLHPVADLLAAYSVENNTLRSLILAILWHGSCFLLIAPIRAVRDLAWSWACRWARREIGL